MIRLGPRTWLRCLAGEREAILAFASTTAAFPAGMLLALAAGLAREYDGAFLLCEPWHALLSLGVSALLGTVFWAAFLLPRRAGSPSWRAFLGLFWLSAPLAWLYAVPYERFLAPLPAYQANLWTLATVAFVRVIWITRVLSVLQGESFGRTLVGVLLLADIEVFVLAWIAPKPVLEFMGGVRGSAVERAVGNTNSTLVVFSALLFPLIGFAAIFFFPTRRKAPDLAQEPCEARSLQRFALLGTLAWLPLLAWAQPEQARRWGVERDLRAGRIREALRTMSSHDASDYPPGWDPPPHPFLGVWVPDIEEVLGAIQEEPVASWVVERFLPKVFHVYYDEDDTAVSVLELRLVRLSGSRGEESARLLLEFLMAHAHCFTPEQRTAVEWMQGRVLRGELRIPRGEGTEAE